MRMLNRNPKRLSAEVFSSAQKQPKQNASSQNREENGSTTLRNTREKPLLAGYMARNISLYSRIIIKTIIKDNYYLFHYFCQLKMDRISISTTKLW